MPAPLLATKLSIPPTGKHLVDRPYLAARLQECLDLSCRMLLVSAPAGFGKTTLVSAWVTNPNLARRQPLPLISWLSLDSGDNVPATFWSYLIAALQTRQEDIGNQTISALEGNRNVDLEANLVSLVNELAQVPQPFILILDDFHFIRNPEIHRSLAFFLDRAPANFHLIVLSRIDPPLPLALWRARCQLSEIRLDDLRFSNQEAAVFLNEGMKLALSENDVDALNAKTEGWAAGLQLAALSMQGRQDVSQFIASFSGSNRFILDYLLEEALNLQPEAITRFLLCTSIVDRLCASLCDALLGITGGSQAVLGDLERANLFIIPLDHERHWYRYHRLFADLLRMRLEQDYDRALINRLHQTASRWYQQNGLVSQAVDHALAADDYELAAKMAEESAITMFVKGEWITLLGWVKRLPESLVHSRPWLCICNAWALIFTGQHESIETLLYTANQLVQSDPDTTNRRDILGNIAVIRARVAARRADLPRALDLADKASAMLPERNLMARSAAEFVKGEAYFEEGMLPEALDMFARARSLGETADNLYVIIPAITEMGKILKIQGKLREAGLLYQQAIERLAGQEQSHPRVLGPVFVGYGDLLREWNDLTNAQNYLNLGIESSTKYGNPNTTAPGYSALAWILQARGDYSGAAAASLEALRLIHKVYARTAKMIIASQAGLCLAQANLSQALVYLEQHGINLTTPISFSNSSECIALARVLMAQEQCREALIQLNQLLEILQAGGYYGLVIQIQNLRALACYTLGKSEDAFQALETSLALAEPEGYVRSFLDEGEPMAKMLAGAVKRGIFPAYAGVLLASFPAFTQQNQDRLVRPVRTATQVALLSDREVGVLRLVAAGLTNKEIAQRLSISLRTVKYHTTAIYTKLGVAGRAQAAVKAEELGLLK